MKDDLMQLITAGVSTLAFYVLTLFLLRFCRKEGVKTVISIIGGVPSALWVWKSYTPAQGLSMATVEGQWLFLLMVTHMAISIWWLAVIFVKTTIWQTG